MLRNKLTELFILFVLLKLFDLKKNYFKVHKISVLQDSTNSYLILNQIPRE